MATERLDAEAQLVEQVARLERELAEARRQRDEALQQQSATGAMLRVIASSSTDLRAVLDAVAERAARLSEANDALIYRLEDGVLVHAASHGPLAGALGQVVSDVDRHTVPGRVMVDRRTIHIRDIAAEPQDDLRSTFLRGLGVRTVLASPLLRAGTAVGVIMIRRLEVRPFTDQQVALLESFADQAVIAIENTRLFSELEERNRELARSLEEQEAIGSILRVMSTSPTRIGEVLDTIAQQAHRVCGGFGTRLYLREGDELVAAAQPPGGRRPRGERLPLTRAFVGGRAVIDGRVVHVADLAAESDEYAPGREMALQNGHHTTLGVPLLRQGEPIGAVSVTRREVRLFTAREIALLETFADQAVIAIENTRLFTELGDRNRDLTDALDQQTATAEVLKAISRSSVDLQSVLDTLIDAACRLCEAEWGVVYRIEDDETRVAAGANVSAELRAFLVRNPQRPARSSLTSRAMLERRTVHIPDPLADPEWEWPDAVRVVDRGHHRVGSGLSVPMLRDGALIGVITMLRNEVRPYSARQVELVETFADQAVIAMENSRLFQDLSQALDRQTATADILRVIASSPTDLQSVLDSLVHGAVRLCAAGDGVLQLVEGDSLRIAAAVGDVVGPVVGLTQPVGDRTWVTGRAILERRTVHVHDLAGGDGREFPGSRDRARAYGFRTMLAVPLLRDGLPLGAITFNRFEVEPFTEPQIRLAETFADQAVIAIENTRLFRDLSEALDRQTATADILRVIASSPTDLQPVLDAVAETAARVCDAGITNVHQLEGGVLELVAVCTRRPDAPKPPVGVERRPLNRHTVTGRAVVDRQTVHVHDLAAAVENDFPESRPLQHLVGHRTILATPLLREGTPVGAITVARWQMRPFTEEQIALLQTFADQAVIAIENTRLFRELQGRVEELRALGEVGRAVSSTLDLNQVLGTVIAHADRLSGTDGGVLYEYDEPAGEFRLRATRQLDDDVVGALRAAPVRLGEGAIGRAALAREPVQVPDITAEGAYRGRLLEAMVAAGHRAVLAVPLLAEGRILGGLVVVRKTPGEFPQHVIELAGTFAAQSALAIQNARLYREVEEKSLQLELASKHKSEFLANMSHELRTPLNAIIGFSEVLLERLFGEVNDRQAEYLQDILSSGQHLLSLINDILDLSKVEAGRMDLEVAEFSLREALDNGLTMLRERASRHGIALTLDIEEGLDLIAADERKVKQVVFNLLSNAVKFTPDGGRVDVSARTVDDHVEVAVRDSGVGIAEEDLPHVFDEFRQVGDGAARAEGTGLGLALTKKLVELHGGRIRAESAVGVGSTFAFTLPLAE